MKIENHTPSTYKRIVAYFIDKLVGNIFLLPVIISSGSALLLNITIEIEIKTLIVCYFLILSYHIIFLKIMGGTIGKLMLGLKVIPQESNDFQSSNLTWSQSVLRVICDQFSLFFSLAHRMLIFARFDRTHLSDWIAGTKVVQREVQVNPPKRNLFWALILVLFFAQSGFFSTYRIFQRVEIQNNKILLHALAGAGSLERH